MSLETQVMELLKDAMKAKDEGMLRGLRAIKAEIIKAKTEPGAGGIVTADGELKLLQKLVKQRKDSLEIYIQQNRQDLADDEIAQALIMEEYLPKQLSEDELKTIVKNAIAELGATSAADMGKVMGAANKVIAGRADGKLVSQIVKELLG